MRSETIAKHPLLWFVCTELAYILTVHLLLFTFRGGLVSMELYWTAIRMVSIFVLVALFKPVIGKPAGRLKFPAILVQEFS